PDSESNRNACQTQRGARTRACRVETRLDACLEEFSKVERFETRHARDECMRHVDGCSQRFGLTLNARRLSQFAGDELYRHRLPRGISQHSSQNKFIAVLVLKIFH